MISHSHSIKMADYHYSKLAIIYQFVMRTLIHICGTEYIGCGKAAGEWLYGKRFFEKHGKVIYNGIDAGKFRFSSTKREQMRQQLGLEDKFVIGHVGHVQKVKNQKFLISLMPEILKRRQEAVLLLLGDGELREENWNYCKELGIEGQVLMVGNVGNVADYLCAMDVFVFPSLYEGMPLSVIEVQCNGLPCVISDSVPDDVFLTDLVKPLGLNQLREVWVKEICNAKRMNEEKYGNYMMQSQFSDRVMLQEIYNIFGKD